MRKIVTLILVLCIVILSGCHREVENITFIPVASYEEVQYLGVYNWVNVAELEGLQGITNAEVYVPIPEGAQWDPETYTYTMPDNQNGESFVMTITLGGVTDKTYTSMVYEMETRVNEWKRDKNAKGSGFALGNTGAAGYVRSEVIEEITDGEETQAPLTKTNNVKIVMCDMLEAYYLGINLEIIKRRGTVDDSTQTYLDGLIDIAHSVP